MGANWFQEPVNIHKVLEDYDELLDSYLLALEILKPRREFEVQWKNFKLSINNTLKTLRQKGYDDKM